MKLYIISKVTGRKVYLNLIAHVRNDLRLRFGGNHFTIYDGHIYHINDVLAESQVNNTAAGAFIGGVLGVLGGPIGLILGAGVGGAIGNNSDQDEQRRVNRFNNSW